MKSIFLENIFEFSGDDTARTIDFSNDTSIEQLDTSVGTSFITHGYIDSCRDAWATELMTVLANDHASNVCCVDWSVWSSCFYVDDVMVYVGLVGQLIAQVIAKLRTDYNMEIYILFGHSLGAHVIGEAGRRTHPPLPICIGSKRNQRIETNYD